MPFMETILGGAAGGIGGTLGAESLKPILSKMGADYQRYMLLFAIIFLIFLWFVVMPGKVRRRF